MPVGGISTVHMWMKKQCFSNKTELKEKDEVYNLMMLEAIARIPKISTCEVTFTNKFTAYRIKRLKVKHPNTRAHKLINVPLVAEISAV